MAKLTDAELEVMEILWKDGELNPPQIEERFPRPIKNSAVRGTLSVLLGKGHVTRRKQGKAYFYKAQTGPETAFSSFYQRLLGSVFGGSREALLVHLIREEKLSEKELLELKRLAEEPLEPTKKKEKRS
jgi:predicted transcriptional regulator